MSTNSRCDTLSERGIENLHRWLENIANSIERLNANSDGAPDREVETLAQVAQYLIDQFRAETADSPA